jgi:hypothetical protein
MIRRIHLAPPALGYMVNLVSLTKFYMFHDDQDEKTRKKLEGFYPYSLEPSEISWATPLLSGKPGIFISLLSLHSHYNMV